MRRVLLIAALLMATSLSYAQNPRAVLKSVLDNEYMKAREKYDKISPKVHEEMPEMCALAKAIMYNMEITNGELKVEGYALLVENLDAIRSSSHLERVLKSCNCTLDTFIARAEQASMGYVTECDNEELYRRYMASARTAPHSDIELLEALLLKRVYNNVCEANTIAEYDRFMEEYAESEFAVDVVARRTLLYYNDAMATSDEATMEQFIANYPDYHEVANVEQRLMEHRYTRVVNAGVIDDMKWFVATYPDYEGMESLKQLMADKEYPTVEDSRASLVAFIEYYPTTTQAADAQRRIEALNVLESADLAAMIEYVQRYGYDRNYTRFLRTMVERHHYLILTEDFDSVTMIRFRNSEGKVGYLNLKGELVVEPKYDCATMMYFPQPSNNSDLPYDFRRDRDVAVVSLNGKWGVLKSDGSELIAPNFLTIGLLNDRIACVSNIWVESNDYCESEIYTYNEYDYNGRSRDTNKQYRTGTDVDTNINWDTAWFTEKVHLDNTDDHWQKRLYDSKGNHLGTIFGGFKHLTANYRYYECTGSRITNIINRAATVSHLNFKSYNMVNIFGDVIFGESNDGASFCVIDLNAMKILSTNEYRRMEPIANGCILVEYPDKSYGYVNTDLKPVFDSRFEYATNFSCGAAAVKDNTGWHLIDTEGKAISGNYQALKPLDSYPGMFLAGKDGKYGVIDANNEIVVPLAHQPYTSPYAASEIDSWYVSFEGGEISWADDNRTTLYEL